MNVNTMTTSAMTAVLEQNMNALLQRELETESSLNSTTTTDADTMAQNVTRDFAIAAYVLTAIGGLFSFGSAIFLYRFRNHQMVSVGQPPFLYLVCFGALLLSLSVSMNTMDPSKGYTKGALDSSCIAYIWLSYVGELIIYMALVCKLWRVQIVSRTMRRRVSIEPKHVIAPFVGVVMAAIVLLVVWTILSPPYYASETIIDMNGKEHFIGTCYYGDGGICQLVLTILIWGSIAAVFWLSRSMRDLPENLSDSRRITQALLGQVILGVLLIIAHFLAVWKIHEAKLNPSSGDEGILLPVLFLSSILYQFLVAILSLGFLVIPKMYYLWYEKRHGRLPSGVFKIGGRVTVQVNGVPLDMAGMSRLSSTSTVRKNPATSATTRKTTDGELQNSCRKECKLMWDKSLKTVINTCDPENNASPEQYPPGKSDGGDASTDVVDGVVNEKQPQRFNVDQKDNSDHAKDNETDRDDIETGNGL